MSYIDTLRHERLGSLLGLALYHPLETRRAPRGSYDFGCTPFNLVLGGGSGEHPALVVHQLEQLVHYYLLYRLELLGEDRPDEDKDASGRLEARLLEALRPLQECYEFCGWTVEQVADLLPQARQACWSAPYDPDRHDSFEHWLAYCLGEFLWFMRPDLAGPVVPQLRAAEPRLAHWLSPLVMGSLAP
jgi:hypothetical protein